MSSSYIIVHIFTYIDKQILYFVSGSPTMFSMKKDSPVAFRISSDLKKKLRAIATKEARSFSQVCDIFLNLGVEEYEKEGSRYVQKFLKAKPDK